MLEIAHHRYSLIILYAIAVHILWALAAWADGSALNSTGLFGVTRLFGSTVTPFVCLAVAVSAAVGLFLRRPAWRLSCMLPQQTVLMLSSFGVLEAISLAQYADGVIRPRAFMIADQAPVILAAFAHTIAIVRAASDNGY